MSYFGSEDVDEANELFLGGERLERVKEFVCRGKTVSGKWEY
jgi:hypothetical protein